MNPHHAHAGRPARLAAGGALVALLTVAALGPALGTASAQPSPQTSFFAYNDRATDQEMAAAGGRVAFVAEFNGEIACSSCGEVGSPENQQWAIGRSDEGNFRLIVHRATNQCVDIPGAAVQEAGENVAELAGTGLVLAACDNSDTQKWKFNFATGNQASFQSKWSGLFLTNAGGSAQLQASARRGGAGTQIFGSQTQTQARPGVQR